MNKKKEYIKPETTVYSMKIQMLLLAGSDPDIKTLDPEEEVGVEVGSGVNDF